MERSNSSKSLKLIGQNMQFSDHNFKRYERDGPPERIFHCPSSKSSPVRNMTSDIILCFRKCNPGFKYTTSLNPRRVLTKPSESASNDSYDNVNSDYIIYVNDTIGSYSKHQYQVLDLLGQGTFGQVVKSINIDSKELVAIKIVKNKPAYFNQGLVEIQILEMLNHQFDADNQHHILRLLDYFVFRNHLCLVFELLSVNLYELIKQNQFRGLSMTLIRCFLLQALDALSIMQKANVLHCDLKPENILLENLTSPSIKVIDYGSACFEEQTVYSYIQSRFYRSPEVLVGVKYTSSIDMWSLGCIAAELFLGLPLFPGSSEYNQLYRIIDMLGPLSAELLESGSKSGKYYNKMNNLFYFKSEEQYAMENNIPVQPSKKYFKYKTLSEIIDNYATKEGLKPHELKKEREQRKAFADLLQGLLKLNPQERWTAEQAQLHPFITGEELTGSFIPPSLLNKANTPPRVIPWGIQNSAHLARPQEQSGFSAMSFPDNFVVGSEPTPYSHSFSLHSYNPSNAALNQPPHLSQAPPIIPNLGAFPPNIQAHTSPRVNRSPNAVRSHSPGIMMPPGMEGAPVGVLAASSNTQTQIMGAATASLSPRGNYHLRFNSNLNNPSSTGQMSPGVSTMLSPRHLQHQPNKKGRQRSQSDFTLPYGSNSNSPQQQQSGGQGYSVQINKSASTGMTTTVSESKKGQGRWQDKGSYNNAQKNYQHSGGGNRDREPHGEQQPNQPHRRRAKSFGGRNEINRGQNTNNTSNPTPGKQGGQVHNFQNRQRGRKRSPSDVTDKGSQDKNYDKYYDKSYERNGNSASGGVFSPSTSSYESPGDSPEGTPSHTPKNNHSSPSGSFLNIVNSDSGTSTGHNSAWNDDLLFDIETEQQPSNPTIGHNQQNSGHNSSVNGMMGVYNPNNDLYINMGNMHISQPGSYGAYPHNGNVTTYPPYVYGQMGVGGFPYPVSMPHMNVPHQMSSPNSNSPNTNSYQMQQHLSYQLLQQQQLSQQQSLPFNSQAAPYVPYQDNSNPRGKS